MLYDKISELKERTANKLFSQSSNPLLNLFNSDKCKEIDERAKNDPVIRSRRDEILQLLLKCDERVSKTYETCFTLFNEIEVLDLLYQKDNSVQFVLKSKVNGIATPDYSKQCLSGNEINLELKALSFKGSDINFRRIQSDIESMDEFNPQWLYQSAFASTNEEFTANTRRDVIEQVSSRITKHYQDRAINQINFKNNSGILLVDTVLIKETLLLFLQDALPAFLHDCYTSGCLWNAVFGEMGNLIFQCTRQSANIKHDPIPPGGQPLRRNGILLEADSLPAIIFIVRTANNSSINLIGFSRSSLSQPDILECLNNFCDYQNDENNSNKNEISGDLRRYYLPSLEIRMDGFA